MDIAWILILACGMNCHKKCEKLMGNLCGVNQKLLSDALSAVKDKSKVPGLDPVTTSNVLILLNLSINVARRGLSLVFPQPFWCTRHAGYIPLETGLIYMHSNS